MNFVALDLGASSTRFTDSGGKFSTLPNNVVFIDEIEPVDLRIDSNDIYDNLEVMIVHDNNVKEIEGYYPMHALIGGIAERFSPNNEYPNASNHKTDQKINYLSLVTAVAISKLMSNLDDKIKVYMTLPPTELKGRKEIARNNIVGKYTVTFPKLEGGKTVEFEIEDVSFAEESGMAITSFFFTLNGTLIEENKQLLTGTVLSLDIGASTTDLAIVKNGRYLEMSGRTYKTGGNTARDHLIEKVQEVYGYELNFEGADRAMAEGRLKFGNTYKDVSEYINEAKKEVAKAIINSIQNYFKSVGINIQDINAIVVSGGGSMSSRYVDDSSEIVTTSQPMSVFITEDISKICSGIDVVNHSNNPRFANIYGLYLRALFDNVENKQ